jgi:NAD(P)-dependent dehydrogenase (short-subunit alcohol dehydrogenase family)
MTEGTVDETPRREDSDCHGAAKGIGRAGAMLFAEHGATVVLVDISPRVGEAADAIRAAGGQAIAIQKDAADDDAVAEAVQTAVEQCGALDIYYANAGVTGERKPFDDITERDWMEVLRVNLISAFLAIEHATRVMVPARRGSIICTTSVAGLRAGGDPPAYSASKAAIINLVQMSAHQFGPSGVRVNAVSPGLIDRTGMAEATFEMARKYGLSQPSVPASQNHGFDAAIIGSGIATIGFDAANPRSLRGEAVRTYR